MIHLKNVSKSFGATLAVDGVSIDIGKGQVVGFLGPNGAGKSTTMRMIMGYLAPDAGEIAVDGVSVAADSHATKSLIGYLPENNPLYEDMIVGDYLRFAVGLRGDSVSEAPIDEVVHQTGIAEVFYRPIGELSKGYRQRVGLAQAILHQPKILILDEPTEGLDPNQRVEIRKLIKEIGRKRTVVLSTHVLQEVESTCDRVLIIDKGRLITDSTIAELIDQAKGLKKVTVDISGADPITKLKALDGVVGVEKVPGSARGRFTYEVTSAPEAELRPLIFGLVKANDWVLWELHQEEASLEDIFRNLTVGDANA